MTAPDPGLTDLIAAALVRSSPNSIDTFDLLPYHRQEAWRVRASEVVSAVEQHTNNRIAKLYNQRDTAIEAGLAAIDRAEKAEAELAEVKADSLRTAFEDQDRMDELTIRTLRAEDAQDVLKAETSGLRYDNEQLRGSIDKVIEILDMYPNLRRPGMVRDIRLALQEYINRDHT